MRATRYEVRVCRWYGEDSSPLLLLVPSCQFLLVAGTGMKLNEEKQETIDTPTRSMAFYATEASTVHYYHYAETGYTSKLPLIGKAASFPLIPVPLCSGVLSLRFPQSDMCFARKCHLG